jgi:hypothetical protein
MVVVLCNVAFWLYAIILEEHTAYIFMAKDHHTSTSNNLGQDKQ